jgi:hypothetical protein
MLGSSPGGLGGCDDPTCGCEFMVLRPASHPNALMLAAGRRLAECLGIAEDRVSWQPLELNS